MSPQKSERDPLQVWLSCLSFSRFYSISERNAGNQTPASHLAGTTKPSTPHHRARLFRRPSVLSVIRPRQTRLQSPIYRVVSTEPEVDISRKSKEIRKLQNKKVDIYFLNGFVLGRLGALPRFNVETVSK